MSMMGRPKKGDTERGKWVHQWYSKRFDVIAINGSMLVGSVVFIVVAAAELALNALCGNVPRSRAGCMICVLSVIIAVGTCVILWMSSTVLIKQVKLMMIQEIEHILTLKTQPPA